MSLFLKKISKYFFCLVGGDLPEIYSTAISRTSMVGLNAQIVIGDDVLRRSGDFGNTRTGKLRNDRIGCHASLRTNYVPPESREQWSEVET